MATAREMPSQNDQPPQIGLVERFRRRFALLNPRCAGAGSLAAASAAAPRWDLDTFLAEGGQDVLDAAHRDGKDVSHRLRDLDDIEAKFGGDVLPRSRWCLMHFVAVLVICGIPLALIAVPNLNLLDPQIRAVLFMHYCPLLREGPFIPEKHKCIALFASTLFNHVGLEIEEFRRFLLIIDIIYLECETTGDDGVQWKADKIAQYQNERLVAAGLDPTVMNGLWVGVIAELLDESRAPTKVFASGGAAYDYVEANLPGLILGPRLAHPQSVRALANARALVADTSKKGKTKSWGVPGPKLIQSSTAAAIEIYTMIADGKVKAAPRVNASPPRAPDASLAQVVVTYFEEVLNKDPAAVEALRRRQSETAKARHAALPPLGKLLFHVRLGNCTFLGAVDAWVSLGASEDATARAALDSFELS